jgi:hypothetical protein
VTVGSVGYIMLHLCVKHLPPQSSPPTNKWWSCHVIAHLLGPDPQRLQREDIELLG